MINDPATIVKIAGDYIIYFNFSKGLLVYYIPESVDSLNKVLNSAYGAGSTYGDGPLVTQVNNALCIPLIYGECKVAGNIIWQKDTDSKILDKVISFCRGEIEDITDIKINNKAISTYKNYTCRTYKGTTTQAIDALVTGTTQEDKVKLVGGLRGIAYAALRITEISELSGLFNLTVKIKGQKVKVYSDLDSYQIKYSNNPAWCILDFLTNYNGCDLDESDIDIASFIESAAYCDEIVNGQPRFTLNLALDRKLERQDWLNLMLVSCRGYFTYENGKISLKIEKAQDSVQHFTPDNIIAGSERFWTIPREKRIDAIKVQYVDPANEYAKIFATAEAEVIENKQPVVQEIQAWGVTNFNQASRLAWFYLNQIKTCNKFISFRTSQEGLDRTVGDVIEITSTFLGYERKKMIIAHLSESQEGQIDIICREYNPDLYTDKLGSAAPVVNPITLPNVFDAPSAPDNLTLEEYGYRTSQGIHVSNIKVSYDEVDSIHLKRYEISYSRDNGETWTEGLVSYGNNYEIKNVETNKGYIVRVQAVTSRDIFSEPAENVINIVGKDAPPENVKEFALFPKGNMVKAVIIPSDEPDIDFHEIRKGLSWDKGELVCKFQGKTTMFRPNQEGTVTYLIKAVDNAGNYSNDAVRSLVNVSGLTPKNIVIDNTFFEEDYEISGNNTEITMPVVDLGVNFEDCCSPKESSLYVSFENMEKYNVEYKCGFSDSNNCSCNTPPDEDSGGYGPPPTEGNPGGYNPPPTEGYNPPPTEGSGGSDVEINWSDWKSAATESVFAGQYVQVRIKSANNTPPPEDDDSGGYGPPPKEGDPSGGGVQEGDPSQPSTGGGSSGIGWPEEIRVIIDVEDIEDVVYGIDIPAQTTTVQLNKSFSVPPSITPVTADFTGKSCSWRIKNIKTKYFDIELLDKDDNLIQGKLLSATARGY